MLISREFTKEMFNHAIATGQIKMKTIKARRNVNYDIDQRWKIASDVMLTILDNKEIGGYKWVKKDEL